MKPPTEHIPSLRIISFMHNYLQGDNSPGDIKTPQAPWHTSKEMLTSPYLWRLSRLLWRPGRSSWRPGRYCPVSRRLEVSPNRLSGLFGSQVHHVILGLPWTITGYLLLVQLMLLRLACQSMLFQLCRWLACESKAAVA